MMIRWTQIFMKNTRRYYGNNRNGVITTFNVTHKGSNDLTSDLLRQEIVIENCTKEREDLNATRRSLRRIRGIGSERVECLATIFNERSYCPSVISNDWSARRLNFVWQRQKTATRHTNISLRRCTRLNTTDSTSHTSGCRTEY